MASAVKSATKSTTKSATKSASSSVVSSKKASDRKLPINLNANKSVGVQQVSGKSPSAKETVVDTNLYEMVGQPVKPARSGDVAKVAAKSTRGAVEKSTISATMRSRFLRREEMRKAQSLDKISRRVVISCCALVAIVLVSLIAVVIYFVVGSMEINLHSYTPKGVTYGREVCVTGYMLNKDDIPKNPNWRECVLAKPPMETNGSCHTVSCSRTTHQFYPSSPIKNELQNSSPPYIVPYRDYASFNEKHNFTYPYNTFCVPSTPIHPEQLRVCKNEQCTFRYNGSQTLYDEEQFRSDWMDNCDEPNPCWALDAGLRRYMSERQDLDHPSNALLFNRDQCKPATPPEECPELYSTATALVWLQHLRCEVNNSDQVGEYCQGFPMVMWECRKCPTSRPFNSSWDLPYEVLRLMFCLPYEIPSLHGSCSAACKGNGKVRIHPFPNGTPCHDEQKSGYCAFGRCWHVEKHRRAGNWNLSMIDDVETCRRKRAERPSRKKPRFPAM